MPLRRVLGLLAFALFASPSLVLAQSAGTIRGRITDATSGTPLVGVQVRIENSPIGTVSGNDGLYTITGAPLGAQFITTRRVGYSPERRAVTISASAAATQNFALHANATTLNEVVVTALGETTAQRSLGTAQQTVKGADIAQTQRENFINGLQGRVAGVPRGHHERVHARRCPCRRTRPSERRSRASGT